MQKPTGYNRKMNLSQYLRQHRLTYEAFGNQVGVTRVAVGSWVRGQKFPTRENMQAIRRVTGGAVTADDFLDLPPRLTASSSPADPEPDRQAQAA